MFIVHFVSESGEDYYAAFEDEPDNFELKVWMIYHFPGEIENGRSYVRVKSITEFPQFYCVDEEDLESQGLPHPDDIGWI